MTYSEYIKKFGTNVNITQQYEVAILIHFLIAIENLSNKHKHNYNLSLVVPEYTDL